MLKANESTFRKRQKNLKDKCSNQNFLIHKMEMEMEMEMIQLDVMKTRRTPQFVCPTP
jgi:hypothetical protein